MKKGILKWFCAGFIFLFVLAGLPVCSFAEPQDSEKDMNHQLVLEQLMLEPVNIEFDPNVYLYGVAVPVDTKKVLVKAVAPEGITYTVSGNNHLQPGENEVIIRLVDETGQKAEYRIIVMCKDADSTEGSSSQEMTSQEMISQEMTSQETLETASTGALYEEPSKEDAHFLQRFWKFVTGGTTVFVIFCILLGSVVGLVVIIVLLLAGGLKKVRFTEEELLKEDTPEEDAEEDLPEEDDGEDIPEMGTDLEVEELDLSEEPKEEHPDDNDFDFIDL